MWAIVVRKNKSGVTWVHTAATQEKANEKALAKIAEWGDFGPFSRGEAVEALNVHGHFSGGLNDYTVTEVTD